MSTRPNTATSAKSSPNCWKPRSAGRPPSAPRPTTQPTTSSARSPSTPFKMSTTPQPPCRPTRSPTSRPTPKPPRPKRNATIPPNRGPSTSLVRRFLGLFGRGVRYSLQPGPDRKTLVIRRPLHRVDHVILDRPSFRCQLQPQLLLQRMEDRRPVPQLRRQIVPRNIGRQHRRKRQGEIVIPRQPGLIDHRPSIRL